MYRDHTTFPRYVNDLEPPTQSFLFQMYQPWVVYSLQTPVIEHTQQRLMIRANQELVTTLGVIPGLVEGAGHPKALALYRAVVRFSRAVE